MSAFEELLALEMALARRDVDAIPGGYEEALEAGFVEFGSSGRVWTRDEILAVLDGAPKSDAISIEGFDAVEVGPGVVLALFETVVLDGATERVARSRRSSLWVRDGDRFRLRFHQGTPVPEA